MESTLLLLTGTLLDSLVAGLEVASQETHGLVRSADCVVDVGVPLQVSRDRDAEVLGFCDALEVMPV